MPVSYTHLDEDGHGLSGAVFRLYAKKTQSTGIKGFAEKMSNLLGIGNDYEIYGDYQVGPNGELTIPNLPWNDYIPVSYTHLRSGI